ncbi:hypothetical protein LCGC14_0596940 [marine sediment metagenome]|uniref:Uncharacterized protein n=1 Tax=marine sediment metagenome TaxID=412755 RepID=A0A0F9TXV2_9ZZZZ
MDELNEDQVKFEFLGIFVGMFIGILICAFVIEIMIGKSAEIALLVATGITIAFGTIMLFTVYLVYFLKTYTIITREDLKEFKKN